MGMKVGPRTKKKKKNKDSKGENFVPSASFNPFVLDVSSMEDKQIAMERGKERKREREGGEKKYLTNERIAG